MPNHVDKYNDKMCKQMCVQNSVTPKSKSSQLCSWSLQHQCHVNSDRPTENKAEPLLKLSYVQQVAKKFEQFGQFNNQPHNVLKNTTTTGRPLLANNLETEKKIIKESPNKPRALSQGSGIQSPKADVLDICNNDIIEKNKTDENTMVVAKNAHIACHSESGSQNISEAFNPVTFNFSHIPENVKLPELKYTQIEESYDDSFSETSLSDDSEFSKKNGTLEAQLLLSDSTGILQKRIQELMDNEQTYINTLTQGINNYLKIFSQKNQPLSLRGQKYTIFGNIERLRDFHQDEFFPTLLGCGENVEKIGEVFIDFIKKDYFYCYVSYAINRKKSETLCEINKEIFMQQQEMLMDKLGVNSFLVEPIQRLPKYKLLLNDIIKELYKSLDNDGNKKGIAAFCRAEKVMQGLLDTVNDSMSINDITELNDFNPLHQGKLRKVGELDVFDHELRRRYRGKLFLFEKGLVITEVLNKDTLQFRGQFEWTRAGFTYEDVKNNIVLYDSKANGQKVEFTGEMGAIRLWMELLNDKFMNVILNEKRMLRESRIKSQQQMDLEPVIVRSSLESRVSSGFGSFSNAWTNSSSESRRGSSFSHGSADNKSTTWYTKLM